MTFNMKMYMAKKAQEIAKIEKKYISRNFTTPGISTGVQDYNDVWWDDEYGSYMSNQGDR